MDALQWSALLIPHPNPRLFTGKKKLYRLAAPSSFDSRSSFMSSLSDGKHKRGKLRKPRTSSPPPKIQPFSFECESPITPNIFDFFSLHDTSDDKDDVQVFTPTSLYTLDGNLMSQPQDPHSSQSRATHFPSTTRTEVSQRISLTVANADSSSVADPMLSFCSNPFGYISRKLTKRRPIPKSASAPVIHSEAIPTSNSISNSSCSPVTVTNSIIASKSTPPINPSCPPLPATNHFQTVIGATDSPILASSAVAPQHARQSTFQCSRLPAENTFPAPSRAICTSETAHTSLQLPPDLTVRLDNAVHPQSALPSLFPAAITELPKWASEQEIERAVVSRHLHPSGSSGRFEPLTLYLRETMKPPDTTQESSPATGSGNVTDKDFVENSSRYQDAIMHRTTDDQIKNKEICLHSVLDHSGSSVVALHNQSNRGVSIASPLSFVPPMTTTTSTSPNSSQWSHRQDSTPTPSTSRENEGTVGEKTVTDVLGTQEVSLEGGDDSASSGLVSLTKWKWKGGRYSMGEQESEANNKSNREVIQKFELSTPKGDGEGSRGRSRSLELDYEASRLISSSPTDKSAVKLTAVTSLLSSITDSDDGTKSQSPTETTVVAVMNADNAQQLCKSLKSKMKPKFIIGGLEDDAVEFPLGYSHTVVRDEPEEQVHSRTALRLRLLRNAEINDGGPHSCGGRRWTLASALTDEKISDDGLVKVLDRMRDDSMGKEDNDRIGTDALDVEKEILEGWGTGIPDDGGSTENVRQILDRGQVPLSESPVDESTLETNGSPISNDIIIHRGVRPKTTKQHNRSRSTPSHAWLAAQRALLTCRELILTERHYLAQLSDLVQQHTATPPPALMSDCANEVLQACERVLKGMEKNPSARGVATAFLEGEAEVQGAYVKWCGVVGDWFSGDGSGQDSSPSTARPSLDLTEVGNRVRRISVKRRNRVGSRTDPEKLTSLVSGCEGEDVSMGSLKRTVSTWRKSMPTLGFDTQPLYGGGDRKKDKESEREPVSPTVRKPPVRELAILPTQRVMRYVMIYQELLSHMPPTSPSRTFVERAAQAAARIAEKCDLAQGNVAFIAAPASHTNGAVSRTSSRTEGQMSPSRVPPLPTSLIMTGPPACVTAPASPISARNTMDSPSRSSTLFFQSSNKNAELTPSPSRLSVSFMSLGWGKTNKQKIPTSTESVKVQ